MIRGMEEDAENVLYRSWTKQKFNLDSCEIDISKEDNRKHVRKWKITTVIKIDDIFMEVLNTSR